MSHHTVQRQDCHGMFLKIWAACHEATSLTRLQLDAGQHPAYDGLAALPFFDDFDLSTVDVLLISQ